GDRALALLIGAERGDEGQTAAILLSGAAGRLGSGCRPRRADAASCARRLVLVRLKRGSSARTGDQVLAEPFLGLLLGFELGLQIVLATLLLVGFARFRCFVLDALGFFARLADERFLFRNLALLRFAQAGIVERMNASLLLLFGQAAQDQAAGRLRCGGRRSRGRGRGRCRRGLGCGRTPGLRAWGRRLGFRADGCPTFHLLDDHRLGAAMAEALAHHPLLNATPFEAQRLAGRDAQLLFT